MTPDSVGKLLLLLVIVGTVHGIIFDKQYLRFNAIIWGAAGVVAIVTAMVYARDQDLFHGIMSLAMGAYILWMANRKYSESKLHASSPTN